MSVLEDLPVEKNIAKCYSTLGSFLSSKLRPISDMYPMATNGWWQIEVKKIQVKGEYYILNSNVTICWKFARPLLGVAI